MSTFRALLTHAGYGKIPCVPWNSAPLFDCCLSICTTLLDTRGLCWRALRHTSHSRSVCFCGFHFARHLHSLPAVYELFYFFEEIVSFWHKGRIKFRDNAGSYVYIATPPLSVLGRNPLLFPRTSSHSPFPTSATEPHGN